MWRRKLLYVLLSVAIWMPVVLYSELVADHSDPFPRRVPDRGEIVNKIFWNESGKSSVVPQETSKAVQEPIDMINYVNVSDSDKISAHSSDQLATITADALPVSDIGKRKSWVLSATTKENYLNRKIGNEPVSSMPRKYDVVEKPKSGEEDMAMGLQKVVSTSDLNMQGHNHKKLLEQSSEVNSRVDKQNPTGGHGESKTSPNTRVRQLKDQLIRASLYLGLPTTRSNPEYIRELRVRTKEIEKVLGDSTRDTELPKNADAKLKVMEHTLAKGKQIQGDCSAVVRKLRAMIQSTEEILQANRKQASFLTQLAAKTVPRGLHCLPLRLTAEFYSLDSAQQQLPNHGKIEDPELYHYALFSDNVLATAVVVNSTVFHAKEPEKHVFHIVTDRINYAAMKMWFLTNPPPKAAIHVQSVEEFSWLNSSYSPVLEQLGSQSMIDYYFRSHLANADRGNLKFRNPKYLSILNHLRFYLPEILPKLNKVVFLDDDIVVQKDLTSLWSIDLEGKVNGAVETCGENFHRFDRYFNFSNPLIAKNFEPDACGWAYGMNVFDLAEWRKHNLTGIYHAWQKLNEDRLLWKLGTLPPGLITFWNRTFPLHRSWHVLGLGYKPNVSQVVIEKAAVIHYNGNMKPWLEIGMSKYRNYWSKFVDYDQDYLRDCNINP